MARYSIITKIFFSVVLMAVEDTNYRFVYVDIGSYGKDCDSTTLKIYVMDINSDKYAGITQ